MNNKFYVSYEAARLLKEKGYNEKATHYYDNDDVLRYGGIGSGSNFNGYAFKHVCTSAPTKAEVIDWLESKGIMIDIHWIRFDENRRWNYSIFNSTCDIIDAKYIYSTRLEAEEAAIIKALEFL